MWNKDKGLLQNKATAPIFYYMGMLKEKRTPVLVFCT